jgi:hypothetical protein
MKNINSKIITIYPVLLFYPYTALSFILSTDNIADALNGFIFIFFISVPVVVVLLIFAYLTSYKIRTNEKLKNIDTTKLFLVTTLATIFVYFIIFR